MPGVAVVLMCGPEGNSPAEQFVAGGRAAAARDALAALSALPQTARVIIATPDPSWAEYAARSGAVLDLDPPGRAFHFGQRLAAVVEKYALGPVFYLGAGSLPLLDAASLAAAVAEVAEAAPGAPAAVTNNLYSSDWLALSDSAPLLRLPHRLPKDNSLGWVLANEGGVQVRSLPPSAGTRVDIDTPFDLLLLTLYPRLPLELARYLAGQAARWPAPALAGALAVLDRRGAQAAIIGRVASAAWAHLEAHTQVWLRVYAEERGMAASGRQEAGRVRSLAAAHLAAVGEARFFAELAELAEAALIDTRLLLAHNRLWPAAADRYRSDVGDWQGIVDPWLRSFTRAASEAGFPVVLGGHGVVAGGLYAMVDILEARRNN